MRAVRLGWLVVGMLVVASVASATGVVTGINTHTGYGLYNGLYQWEFGATAATSSQLGKVALGTVFGYDIKAADVAMLSDGRIVIPMVDSTNTKWQISVLTPVYTAGLLTGVTVNATFDQVSSAQSNVVAPLPHGGFVALTGNQLVFYDQNTPNVWTPTIVTHGKNWGADVAGLVTLTREEAVIGEYARNACRWSNLGSQLAWYDNDNAIIPTNKNPWGDGALAEGLRNPLLQNGWLVGGSGDWGNNRPTVVMDGTETNGGRYKGVVGEVTNSDGSAIIGPSFAALQDGRVVGLWAGGYGRNTTQWRPYTLVQDPGGRTGTIGANGEDFIATLGLNQGGSQDNFVGRIAGDYMYEPPPPPVAEPAIFGLMLLGLPLALRRRKA